MTTLQLSDLFQNFGKNFDWDVRKKDQDKLIERLGAIDLPDIKMMQERLTDFCGEGIASYNFLEYYLSDLTKMCSRLRIDIL